MTARALLLLLLAPAVACSSGPTTARDAEVAADERGPAFADRGVADALAARDADPGADDASLPGDSAAAASDATSASDAAAPPWRIYLDPQGDDAADGSSVAQPIRTLGRAHALLVQRKPQRDVELRIAPGTYYGQTVVWSYSMPAHSISFMTRDGDKNRPIFDGCKKASATAADCPGGTWLTLSHAKGQETNLRFWYIQVQRYQTAISFNGARDAEGHSNGSNRIFGCYFYRIGNVFNPQLAPSTAAVRLVNSDDNEIANSHFVDIVNTTSGGLLHALYVAHMSDRNKILRNRFKNISGDPIRLRDFSNRNTIDENKLTKSGSAGYSDWYCDHEVNTACTKPTPECPSWENLFRNNLLDGTYDCKPLRAFVYYQDASTAGCAPPAAGAARLHTSGNTSTAVPCTN